MSGGAPAADLLAGATMETTDGMDGRGPAQVRAGDPGCGARGHARPLGADDPDDRSTVQGRAATGLVDPHHAHGLVAPGPRRLHLATAAGHVPAAYDGLGPLAW